MTSDAAIAREAKLRFLVALYNELGGEGNAAMAHAEFRRIRAKYRPHPLPSDAAPGERDAVDRWESAYRVAKKAAFSQWPNLDKGAWIEVTFRPTYLVRVRRGQIGGYAGDRARLSILYKEYVVEHDRSALASKDCLIFRDADERDGGDLIVELAEYVELAAFPHKLARTQLEVIDRLY